MLGRLQGTVSSEQCASATEYACQDRVIVGLRISLKQIQLIVINMPWIIARTVLEARIGRNKDSNP